jgi:putative DNA primase/helicase
MRTVQEVLDRLQGVKQHGKGWKALCPVHSEREPSLEVKAGDAGRPLLYCHGCNADFDALCSAIGFRPSELLPDQEPSSNGRLPPQRETTYDYTDADGKLLYQVVRRHGRKFLQRRPDGKGDWIWNLEGVTPVLYRLPAVIAAVQAKRTIFIVEGEKDVHTLEAWKLVATTNSGGAEKWGPSHTRALIGARVVILPDNDEKGHRHMLLVAHSLRRGAEWIRVLDLPGLPDKGDVSDWVQAGGTYDEFTRLAREAPLWTAGPQEELPAIVTSNRPLRDLTRDALQAL